MKDTVIIQQVCQFTHQPSFVSLHHVKDILLSLMGVHYHHFHAPLYVRTFLLHFPSLRLLSVKYECLPSGEQFNSEGTLWRDPPDYWENIVWPAYVAAHSGMLEDGDVEKGKSNGTVTGLIVVDGLDISMDETVALVCERLVKVAQVTG